MGQLLGQPAHQRAEHAPASAERGGSNTALAGLPIGEEHRVGPAQQIVESLAKDQLSAFDVYVATVAAAEYLCPNLSPQALKVIGTALDS